MITRIENWLLKALQKRAEARLPQRLVGTNIPAPGRIMECDGGSAPVTVQRVDEFSVTYRRQDGQVMTRCKRGFMKHYRQSPNTQIQLSASGADGCNQTKPRPEGD